MALEQPITERDEYFTGEDKTMPFTIYVSGTTIAQIEAGTAIPQNIAGWSLVWMVKRRKTDPDSGAKAIRTTGGGGIVIDAPGAAGTGSITLTDADIEAIKGGVLYWHELRRSDPAVTTVLFFGPFILRQGVQQ